MGIGTEKFMRYIMNLDFDELVGEDNVEAFALFVREQIEKSADKIVLRFFFEKGVDDEIPLPYYVWAIYPMDSTGMVGGEMKLIPPDYEDPMTYLSTPSQVDGPYFEVVVED